MPVQIRELARRILPNRTALFLGAGASVPSGAPTGSSLARSIAKRLTRNGSISEDFVETCSILDYKYGREALVAAIRTELADLRPSGGLLAVPSSPWSAIYTTNFDRLVELSYGAAREPIVTIRSNFDFGKADTQDGTPLYKLHGCISQDAVDGSLSRMLLTERDYEEFIEFRETMFRRLALDLVSKDLLIVGYSLSDPHLRKDVTEAATLRAQGHTTGRIYVLAYERNDDRAALLETRGITVAFGDIDELLYAITEATPEVSSEDVDDATDFTLPVRIIPTVVAVQHARTLAPDVHRLFNGSPATYADIAAGLSIERSVEMALMESFLQPETVFLTILGVAGVGKTTLARRIALHLTDEAFDCWEHRSHFPFRSRDWIEIEHRLRGDSRRGVLIIDDCPDSLRQINLLADHLGTLDEPALRVILTASLSQWRPRTKSPVVFARGITETVSTLSELDIWALVNLIEQQPVIRALVESSFGRRSRHDQIAMLRRRCRADMYVCLKNIFATDALDTILLREYAGLEPAQQSMYRYVSALEAAGSQVHRQLIVRTLNIAADVVASLLSLMEGLVEEFDISPVDGLYGWSTRHRVIAQTITRYKFADQDERFELFKTVIAQLNPSIWIELRSLRNLCEREFGIGSLGDDQRQLELYRMMMSVAPGERIPRHRLISKLLHLGDLEAAEQEIRSAENACGYDSPLNRFKVRLAIRRAEITAGVLPEDRKAMLLEAERLARSGIRRNRADKYAYISLGEVAAAMAELTEDVTMLDLVLEDLQEATSTLLDPQLSERYQELVELRRRYP